MPPMLPPQSAQHPAARRKIRSGGGGGGGVCVVAVGVAVVWLSTTVVAPPFSSTLSITGHIVQRAEAMYRRCLEVNPEHGFALYNLAVLKEETTKNGDYSEVSSYFCDA